MIRIVRKKSKEATGKKSQNVRQKGIILDSLKTSILKTFHYFNTDFVS